MVTIGTAPRDYQQRASPVMAVLDIVDRMSSEGAELETGMAQPVKRPLIRENLNVIQNTSPRRLMPHLLHQMVQNRTNLGGHSIQMMIIINQATT